jgi:uncharacterized membrane protein SpoIIM required for sporulation
MRADQLLESRQADWKTLSQLLDRCRGGVHRLSSEEIETLGNLYRAATSDLALAQRDFPGHRVTIYLNQLVGRAHAVIYRGEPLARRRLVSFVKAGLPRAFRRAFPFVLVAALSFILPALLAGLGAAWQPKAARWLLPAEVQRLIPMIEKQELWTDIPIQERPYTASFIMRNNIQVAFLAFSSGVLVGLPTLWVMISNGLALGGITGLTIHYGVGHGLWSFVIGHGVIELSVIFIAGGSGLMMGWAVVHPGLWSRRDSLIMAARQAIQLVMGCVPLLMIAGLIEGLISPAENVPWPVKWGIGLGSGVLLYSYLFLAGRKDESSGLQLPATTASSLSAPGSG